MHKKFLTLLTLILILCTLSSCQCNHEWQSANCTKPEACALCGETRGTTVDHVFKDATCSSPQTCMKCGYKVGSVLEHEYSELSCSQPQVCTICGHASGKTKVHNYSEASCTIPMTCTECGETKGDTLWHNYSEATYTTPQTCINCGKTTGDVLKLSDSCDKVLACGYEINGDYYELVANESESYSGVNLEVGVIKNNAWLLPLTSEMPLIDEDGTFFGREITTIHEKEYLTVLYIGNGCFFCESIDYSSVSNRTDIEYMIYNCNTQKYFNETVPIYKNRRICLSFDCIPNYYETPSYSDIHALNSENNLLITDFRSYDTNTGVSAEVSMLDTTSMTSFSFKMDLPRSFFGFTRYVYPMSDGLFAVANLNESIIFYDVSGNPIIQKDFKLLNHTQNIVFIDGKCTFDIQNNNGTAYTITIDDAGNVIDSVEKVS